MSEKVPPGRGTGVPPNGQAQKTQKGAQEKAPEWSCRDRRPRPRPALCRDRQPQGRRSRHLLHGPPVQPRPPADRQEAGRGAVEALIEGIRGDRGKLVVESADVLYHLLTLWAASNVKPRAVWAELARREGISGIAEKAARKQK